MSDLMLLGVLRMPLDMVLSDPLSTAQFHSRAQQAADRIESDADLIEQQAREIERLREAIQLVAEQDPVELALDPTWAKRIASVAICAAKEGAQ